MSLLTSPYDTAQTALNAAIVFANDAGSPLGMAGNILNPARNPAVIPALFERWRYLQDRLRSGGVDTFRKEGVVYNLPAAATSNASIPMELTFRGYWNGGNWFPVLAPAPWDKAVTYTEGQAAAFDNGYYLALPAGSPPEANLNKQPDESPDFWRSLDNLGPALPTDLIKPLEVWERISGGNVWLPMCQKPDSLNRKTIQPRFGAWYFENDRMQLPASSQDNDLRIKYLAQAPDIYDLNSPLMVRGCTTALALLLLDQLAGGRGGTQADAFKARAEEAINQIINQTVSKQAYSDFSRQAYRGGRRGRR